MHEPHQSSPQAPGDVSGERLFVDAWDAWEASRPAPPQRAVLHLPAAGADSDIFVRAWNSYVTEQPVAADATPASTPAAASRWRGRRIVREVLQTAALAVFIFGITQSAVQGREVDGPSMRPSYYTGQHVLVNRLIYARWGVSHLFGLVPIPDPRRGSRFIFHSPQRGEVIIFDPPIEAQSDLIKRVIGVPGDNVRFIGGAVFVNGQKLEESYAPGYTKCENERWCDYTLGRDEYFVMGDNRGNSTDSRIFGPVKADRIIGKAWLIYRPLRDFGLAP